jgi:hypothetical protein
MHMHLYAQDVRGIENRLELPGWVAGLDHDGGLRYGNCAGLHLLNITSFISASAQTSFLPPPW